MEADINMKITFLEEVTHEVTTLKVRANARYWEDAIINDVEDTTGSLIPCREGDMWRPVIDIDQGLITNWTIGVTASIHYKICDEGCYQLINDKGDVVAEKEGYVPKCMSPKEDGYGDYIIMDIDEKGYIKNWKKDFSDIGEDE